MKSLIRLLLVGLLLSAPMASQAGDPVITFAPDDPAMNTAIKQARDTLAVFLANVLDAKGVSQTDTALKVAFQVDAADYGDEIIWVSGFSRNTEGRYIGYLANEPNHMPGKQVGSKVRFTAHQIRDWGYFGKDGKLFGHYTTRVLLKTMPQDQAEPILDLLSDHPVPDRWKPL